MIYTPTAIGTPNYKGGRERGRDGGREAEREGGREGKREGGREELREGGKEGWKEGGREGGRGGVGGSGQRRKNTFSLYTLQQVILLTVHCIACTR